MIAYLSTLLIILTLFFNSAAFANIYYGSRVCRHSSEFTCYVTKRGDRWEKLFPDSSERDIIMRINRIGIQLEPGMTLAIPRNYDDNVMDYSPFPRQISPPGERLILVSLSNQAWGAYDQSGNEVRWGPVSSARGYCPDEGRSCHTSTGHFMIYHKEGAGCVSTKFPIPRGGAPMPYCMYFHGGFALHGSYEVPGYNASHGCIRMFVNDAKWMNEDFVGDELNVPVIVSH
jgi:hypothetical protein